LRLETYLSTEPPAPCQNARFSNPNENPGGAQCVEAPPSEEPLSPDSLKRSFDLSSIPKDLSAATPKRVSAGLRRRAAPQRITMHGLLPAQRFATLTLGHHHAGPSGQSGEAQSSATPRAGSISPESSGTPGRLGHPGESARGRGEGFLHNAPAGTAEVVSAPGSIATAASGFVKLVVLSLIRFYQACLSPVLPSNCRFYPSCSSYAFEAVEKWGVWHGGRLALGRLLRCRPWGRYGYDPVPEK
jgi:putative membrane protein insertion efficiency factor